MFQSELCAILDAALTLGEILSNDQYRGHPIYFYSDSMSSLQALKGHETNSKLVLECHEALNKLAELTTVTLTYIPGHSNFSGNELADVLARQGSGDCEFIGQEPAVGKNRSHCHP